MSQCLRISFVSKNNIDVLCDFIQRHAHTCKLEGTVQAAEKTHVKIVACGHKDNVEKFLDTLHKQVAEEKLDKIEVEPFLKDRDYRGVFRIIE